MAEEENQREADEERMIRLSAPAVLDDEALKAVMTEDIASNRPEYMAEVAERHGLDLERDAAAVRDTVYEEQLGVIVETCIANALTRIRSIPTRFCREPVISAPKTLPI